MILSLIVAMTRNRVIGKDNDMPWHLPADLRYFKQTTSGHPIIMGRKTYESIGRPLPKRRNIVLTRNPDYQADGIECFQSIDEVIAACGDEEEVFIIGGAEIYQNCLDKADRLYITRIGTELEGDTFFPEVDFDSWELLSEALYLADEKNIYNLRFQVWQKKTD